MYAIKSAKWLRTATACKFPMTRFSKSTTHLGISRHYVTTATQPSYAVDVKMLQLLEAEANAFPSNVLKQRHYLQRLVRAKPEEVVSRFESGLFTHDKECASEYLEALKNMNQLQRVSSARVKEALEYTVSRRGADNAGMGSSIGSSSAEAAFHGRGTEAQPLLVQLHGMQKGNFMASFIKTTVLFVIFLSLADAAFSLLRVKVKDGDEPKSAENVTTTFADVMGADEAKHELEDIVEYLRDPSRFTGMGGKMPRGVLLMGPPGTGKTLLAKAVAGEANVPFFYASGSEFEEMFVGVGAKRVRDLFAAAKKSSPCIVFIDELDAVGGTRSGQNAQWTRMTLNQLLVELDGFEPSDDVIVIAATNFPASLDKALIRPGRFDVHVTVPLPDVKGRTEIIKLYLTKVKADPSIDPEVLARGTPGVSGAELFNLINSAAIKASLDKSEFVTKDHLEWAKDKVLMGPERKSAVIPEAERRNTAYHEGGHALVAMNTKGAMPVHKATIMPRGMALGYVSLLPEGDMSSVSREQMLAQLDVAMGGRVAEELIFGRDKVTSGASNDLQGATDLARRMVVEYGMSARVGPVHYGSMDRQTISPETQAVIDHEVRALLEDSMIRVTKLLKNKSREHHRIAQALIKYETLDAEELKLAASGKLVK